MPLRTFSPFSLFRPFRTTPGGTPGGDDEILFHALSPDDDGVMQVVLKGVGGLIAARTADIWLPDHEGVYREFLSTEPGVAGGRVVRNLVLSPSSDFSGWLDVGALSNGTREDDGFTLTGGPGWAYRRHSTLFEAESYVIIRFNLAAYASNIVIRLTHHSDGTVSQSFLPAGIGEHSLLIGPFNTDGFVEIGIDNRSLFGGDDSSAGEFLMSDIQLENVTGQSDQNPGEYVPVGTGELGGLGVDGLAVFAHENGNTVASNVVTEAKGADLPEMPYLVRAPQATNLILYSRDLTHASWTATTVTVTKDAEGIDGAPTSACTLTATAGNGTVICDAVTAASGNHATAWHIRRKTGTGDVELTTDGGTTWQDITSQVGAAYARIAVDQAVVTNPEIGIRLVTDTDAVYVGNAECYAATTKEVAATLPPIFTNGSSESRDADADYFDSANWSDTEGSVYLEADVTGTAMLVDGLLDIANGFVGLKDGTSTVRASSLVEGLCQIGWVYGPAGMRLCVDGTWTQTVPYDGGMLQGIFDLYRSAAVVGGMRNIQGIAKANEQWVTDKMPVPADYGDDFVMVVQTTAPGETFTLPCGNTGTYNAVIDWGDGTSDSSITSYNDADLTHTYADAGKHTMRVSGTLPWIYFSDGGDKAKVIAILNGGSIGSLSAQSMFFGCTNLVVADLSNFDTAAVTNMSSMFQSCPSLTSLDVSSFDTAAVTNMYQMFYDCSSLTSLDLSSFGTAAVTNMSYMFKGCSNLTTLDVSSFGTAAVTDMSSMFNGCQNVTAGSMDGFLSALYASRMATVWATPVVDISPCNAPSGTYQDATPPTTGEEFRYKLENDPDGESFPQWAITV